MADESVLGELSCNFNEFNIRSKAPNGKIRSGPSSYDDDIIPQSKRSKSIDITQDAEHGTAGIRPSNKRQASSLHSSSNSLSSNNTGTASTSNSRGDRFIPNRDISKSGGLLSDHLCDTMGGETLSNRRPSVSAASAGATRENSPFDRTVSDQTQNLTQNLTQKSDFAGDLDDDYDSSNAPSDLGSALQMQSNHRILSFNAMAPDAYHHAAPELRNKYNPTRPKTLPTSLTTGARRRIATTPEKTLDTPDMRDDFYSHLLSWSSQNVIAIALGASVHTWNGNTGEVMEICDLLEMSERIGGGFSSHVKTITWDDSGTLLQVSTNTGHVQIWDIESQSRVRTFKPTPDGRDAADNTSITTTSWAEDGTLALGYWSGLLREHDLRQRESVIRDIHGAHAQSICGMTYRSDSALLATGGNDNVVKVWDRRTNTAKMQKERHRAAVRALSWSPMNSSLLASGGGTLDKMIHFWNVTQGTRLQSIQTDAQVTAIHWSQRYKEIASCHGVASSSSEGSSNPSFVNLWNYPTLDRLESLAAHESRTLHSCLSPDGQVLATCGTDESLKFWRIFEVLEDQKSKASTGSGLGSTSSTASSMKKMHSLR